MDGFFIITLSIQRGFSKIWLGKYVTSNPCRKVLPMLLLLLPSIIVEPAFVNLQRVINRGWKDVTNNERPETLIDDFV